MGTLHQISGDLSKRWRRTLELLSATGLSPLRGESSLVAKLGISDHDFASESPTSGVRLGNNQVVWIRDDAPRDSLEDEYRGVGVLDEIPTAHKATIAATSALESKPLEGELTTQDFHLYLVGADLPGGSNASENRELGAVFGRWFGEWAGALKDASRRDGQLAGITNKDSVRVLKHLP